VTFSVPLVNSGNATATAVSGTLTTSTPGVSILDASSAYANIATGATVNPNAGDTLAIQLSGSVLCGSGVDLTYNVSTAQGAFAVPIHFDVGSKTVTTQNLTGSTGAVNNDINNPSIFTTPSATAGTIQGVTVDVNITNPTSGRGSAYLFGDYVAELVAPSSTAVKLHSNPLPCSSLVGSYPNTRLAQEGTLDALKGQDAAGVWSLRVTSRNNIICSGGGPSGPCSSATVNSWALHVTRESTAACNTCVSNNPPPEVSAPASGTPLILTYDDTTGAVTFTWQNLGSQADSYRLLSGLISSLAGTGMTSSNTAPVQCGIVAPGTTLVPPAGDRFFLVAAQKGSLVGPLGQATDPVTFPRSSSLTCP
jgi:subtilisin-like proprotein convertase family protein